MSLSNLVKRIRRTAPIGHPMVCFQSWNTFLGNKLKSPRLWNLSLQGRSVYLLSHAKWNNSRHVFKNNIAVDCRLSHSRGSPPQGIIRLRKPDKNALAAAIQINKDIVDLGNGKRWGEILDLFVQEKQFFSPVNYATVMTQLGRIPDVRREDPRFQKFLLTLNYEVMQNGLRWLQSPQVVANIFHAFAKMELSPNLAATQIVESLEMGDNAKWLFKKGNPQAIANCVWACAKLSIQSPKVFTLLDQNAAWLHENGTAGSVAMCAWACAELEIQCPNIFARLESNPERFLEGGDSHAVSSCVWACEKLDIRSPKLARLRRTKKDLVFHTDASQSIAN